MSLTEELKHRSSFPWKKIIIWLVIVWLAGWWYTRRSNRSASTTEDATASTTATAKKGNITIGVTSDGQIMWDNVLTLGFEVGGKIKSITKNIGDKVTQWELIATVDSAVYQTSVRKAQNSLNQAIASYNSKVKPLSDLQIQQINAWYTMDQISFDTKQLSSEQDLTTAQKSIQDLKTKRTIYEQDLQDLVSGKTLALSQAQANQQLTQSAQNLSVQVDDLYQKIEERLRDIDDFMWFSLVKKTNSKLYETFVSARDTSIKYEAEILRQSLNNRSKPNTVNLTGQELLDILDLASKDAQNMRDLASKMTLVMDNTVPSDYLTDSEINSWSNIFSSIYSSALSKYQTFVTGKESYKSSLLSNESSLDNSSTSFADQKRSIEQQIAQIDTDITYQQWQLEFKQTTIAQAQQTNNLQLQKDQIDYQLQLNPLTDDEQNLYSLQLESSRIALAEQQLQLSKTNLYSPVDGVILTIAGHPGETAWSNFVSIATQWYTYIQTTLDQEDINSLSEWQIASMTLDALPDLTFTGEVYYISSQWVTDNNGLVTYQVLIRYALDDERVKIGMKGTLTFVQKEVKNVITLPVKAVFAYENTPHVLLSDGTMRAVITWLSDGKTTEIISGLEEGEEVIIK